MRVTEIITDDSMRELRSHGSADFPFEYYYDDIHAFDKRYIDYHWHNEFEWCVIDKGTVDYLIGSSHITLFEGDGIFINSKAIHSFKSENGGLMPNILFSPNMIAPDHSAVYSEYILPVLNSGCAYFVLRKSNENERRILEHLKDIFTSVTEMDSSKLDIQIAICTLWRDFIKVTDGIWSDEHDTQSMLLQSRIRTMIEFIRKNYEEKITLTDIAYAANISKSEALRCFHEAIETTPVNYLIEYRLSQGRRLLMSTNDSVTQIAIKIGFDSVNYFIRAYKNRFGLTPRAFRLQYKAK